MKEEHYKIKSGTKIEPLDAQRLATDVLVPRLPFSMILNGAKSAGKSTLLINLLTSTDLLAGKFNKIVFYSPTVSLDSKMQKLAGTEGLTFINKPLQKAFKKLKRSKKLLDTTDMEIDDDTTTSNIEFHDYPEISDFQSLMEYQKTIIEVFSKPLADRVLLVFDDLASKKKLWTNETFLDMLLKSRHVCISILICTQAYYLIPKPVRLNNSMLVMFETANVRELESVYAENKCKYPFRKFLEIANKVFSVPFNIFVFNNQNPNRDKKLQIGFNSFVEDVIYNDGATSDITTRKNIKRDLLQ